MTEVIRSYTVTQEREVKVTAYRAVDATLIADAAFNSDPMNPKHGAEGIWGNITTDIRVQGITVREDY